MSYKFINTFIDDLFAFIVPMPTMHRLACFRDDIVFFIFLYQRYLYPVDKARRNEYGQSAKMSEDAEKVIYVRALHMRNCLPPLTPACVRPRTACAFLELFLCFCTIVPHGPTRPCTPQAIKAAPPRPMISQA